MTEIEVENDMKIDIKGLKYEDGTIKELSQNCLQLWALVLLTLKLLTMPSVTET
jgi:hypothetical protein